MLAVPVLSKAFRSMSSLFPEQPILFYPSLACRFGAEPAILLAVYHQYARHHGGLDEQGTAQFVIRRREWLDLAPYWDEDKLALLTNTLVEQGLVDAQFLANGSIRLAVLDNVTQSSVAKSSKLSPDTAPAQAATPVPVSESKLAVTTNTGLEQRAGAATIEAMSVRVPSPRTSYQPPSEFSSSVASAIEEPSAALIEEPLVPSIGYGHVARGPAPSFGGSTGWVKPQDPLEQLFAQQEQHNRQLKEINPNWEPQPSTLQMLSKQSVTQAFALACVDQFVAYYMEQGQRKKSWEQPFMKWVKRDWVDAQKQQNRQQPSGSYPTQSNNQQGYNGERDQTRTRQDKRERITNAVMDIKNTDW